MRSHLAAAPTSTTCIGGIGLILLTVIGDSTNFTMTGLITVLDYGFLILVGACLGQK